MVYVLYQNKVSPYHNDHQHYATFQPSWFDLVDQCVSQKINRASTFEGMFSQPFRVLLRDLHVPQPTITIHSLSQCYGASPSYISPLNQKLIVKCVSSDNCFQCSPISPSLLFLNKWRLPFYQESCFLAEMATRREGKGYLLIAISTERLYLLRCLNILCGTTLNNEPSCRLINKNRAIFIVCFTTVVRGSNFWTTEIHYENCLVFIF
jgi:hypothetical protein